MIRASGETKHLRIQLIRWGLVAAFLAFWQWKGSASDTAHFFYSTPLEVVSRLFYELHSGTLLSDTAVTCEEVLLGSSLGLLAGFALGLLLWWFNSVGRAVQPIIFGLATIPVFAVAPLLVFWFGVDLTGKVVVVGLSVVFICLLSTYQAARQIEDEYYEVAYTFHATRAEVFRRLVLKGSILIASPSYRLAIIFGFVGAFIAEIISSSRGLGHFIQRSSGLYDVAGILAGLTVFIACALAVNLGLEQVDRILARWR
jgi:NitT/TauT family transport system permease protein